MGNENMDMLCDKIRGSLFGGAVGDALGYPIEFFMEVRFSQNTAHREYRSIPLMRKAGKP